MDALEQQADRLFEERKYPEALDIYLSLAQKYPKAEKYSMYCGSCFDAIGQAEQAVKFYKKASKQNPVSVQSLLALANLYYHNQNYDEALRFAQLVLKKEPKNVSALLVIANVAYCKNDYERAFELYEQIHLIDPSNYVALVNMANTAYDLGRFVKAAEFAQEACQINPSSVDAYIISGNSYMELNRIEKAETNLLKALGLRGDNPWIYNALSRLYQKTEDYKSALAFGWKSVLFGASAQNEQHINFGYLLYECACEGKEVLAKNYALKWIDAFPQNDMVAYMAGAILNERKFKKADEGYVTQVFDMFANDFDTTLKGLEYMAPTYIASAVKEHYNVGFFKKTNYLDLGCGTGLCALNVKKQLFRSYIVGVDLSLKMLEQARLKNIYDVLEQDDLLHFLQTDSRTYDLITAADVLTYFGDLREVFENAANRLKLGGLFVFTISENAQTKDDYLLTPSGRFVHHLDYISGLLKKCGYSKLSFERKALRNEGDKVVWGYVVVAEKIMILKRV